jgi:thiosulfate reductase cytochrome b subunit
MEHYRYFRHRLAVRIMHWVNVLAVIVLLMSGLQIFNAHATLYWGQSSYSGHAPVLQITAMQASDGSPIGVTRVLGHEFQTTGVLGVSHADGQLTARAFPTWATIPGPQWLAMQTMALLLCVGVLRERRVVCHLPLNTFFGSLSGLNE